MVRCEYAEVCVCARYSVCIRDDDFEFVAYDRIVHASDKNGAKGSFRPVHGGDNEIQHGERVCEVAPL